MSQIDATFARLRAEGRKALIPFITAGDPEAAVTVPLMHALVRGGADVIELGVPFSDPMADGPTIQRASERALARGMTMAGVLACVREFRQTDTRTPIVLMGYANPIEAMGLEAFAQAARAAGVDGVLVVDYPPEEADAFAGAMVSNALDPIFLIAPTTTDARIEAVARLARGYIYYVSIKGVTGARHLDVAEVAQRLARVRAHAAVPVGVGFGMREAETAGQVATVADAVVVGSRLIEEIERVGAAGAVTAVETLVAGLRRGIDAAAKGV